MGQSAVARFRSVVLLVTLAMVATACGLRPSAEEVVFRGGPGGTPVGEGDPGDFDLEAGWQDDEDFDFGPDDPEQADRAADAAQAEPADGDPGRPARTGQPQDQAQPQAQQQPQQGRQQVRGSDRTGVTDDTISLAAHAPVTGAAPLPARSFEQAADLYWRWVIDAQNQTVLGRTKVELVFADDRYQPSTAVQVCRQLAENAFLLAGAGGTDQVQACGRFANQARVPYFSAGVTSVGLEGLPWYFAFSMTYEAQGELLAQYVARNFGDARTAAILTDTRNWDDAVQGWERGVQRHGINYYRTLRHPRGDTAWYNTFARELAQQGVEVLYINSTPGDYIRFAQQAEGQGFTPQFVGVGITMGLNPVLESGCDFVDGGIFFSPFPGLDWARQNEPEFFRAAERFGTPDDDLAFGIWGQAKSTHETFRRYGQTFGNDLTREDFRAFVEQQRDISGGIFPPVSYSPDDHFGANQVHVLQADCSIEEYRTLHTFVSGF